CHVRQDPDGAKRASCERHIAHCPAECPAILQSHTCLGVLPAHGPISSQRFRNETIQSKLLLCLRSSSLSHPSTQAVVGHQDQHPREQCRLVASRYDKASLPIVAERRHTARICRHHSAPAPHGVHYHIGSALIVRGMHQKCRIGQYARNIRTIAHELDAVSYSQVLCLVLQCPVPGAVPNDLHQKIASSPLQFS